jgi:uncharacterized protein YdbL (DUF1318 family)
VRKQLVVLLAVCGAAACNQNQQQALTGASATAPPTVNEGPPITKPEEHNILRIVAMYDEFERQAIARRLRPNWQGGIVSCNDALIARISRERDLDLAELASAARTMNLPTPDGALGEDYKGYLGLITGETAFAAEQALIHSEVIAELQHFAAAFPESPIRPWADRTIVKLDDRLNEINPAVCANTEFLPVR